MVFRLPSQNASVGVGRVPAEIAPQCRTFSRLRAVPKLLNEMLLLLVQFSNILSFMAYLLAYLISGHQRERRLGEHRRRTRHRLGHGGRGRGRRHRLLEIQIRYEIGTQKYETVTDYRCGGGGRGGGGGGGVEHGRRRRVMRRVSLGVKVRRYGE